MPIVNVVCADGLDRTMLVALRELVAQELSGESRSLTPEEVSVRQLVPADESLMIATCEVDISAYAYPDRVARQDEICRNVETFLSLRGRKSHVWLMLGELGHSWKE